MTVTDEIELNRIRKKWAGEGTIKILESVTIQEQEKQS